MVAVVEFPWGFALSCARRGLIFLCPLCWCWSIWTNCCRSFGWYWSQGLCPMIAAGLLQLLPVHSVVYYISFPCLNPITWVRSQYWLTVMLFSLMWYDAACFVFLKLTENMMPLDKNKRLFYIGTVIEKLIHFVIWWHLKIKIKVTTPGKKHCVHCVIWHVTWNSTGHHTVFVRGMRLWR